MHDGLQHPGGLVWLKVRLWIRNQTESGLRSNRLFTDRRRVRLRLILPVWPNSIWCLNRCSGWIPNSTYRLNSSWNHAGFLFASPWPNAASELKFVLNFKSTNTPNHHPEFVLTGLLLINCLKSTRTPAWYKNSTTCRQDLVVVKQHLVGSILPDWDDRNSTGWKTGWEHSVANSTIG